MEGWKEREEIGKVVWKERSTGWEVMSYGSASSPFFSALGKCRSAHLIILILFFLSRGRWCLN